jgi:hypothetical protein
MSFLRSAPFGRPHLDRVIPVKIVGGDREREGALQPEAGRRPAPAVLGRGNLEQVLRLGTRLFSFPATGQGEHPFDRGIEVSGFGK